MDHGICPGNYFDYPDDDVAIQREFEIADGLTNTYLDRSFPPNARSLYFDPLNPPKGAIPNESTEWFSLCEKEVVNCDEPTYFFNDKRSSWMEQGSLGDNYFLNSLRLLTCSPKMISRLLVSDKFASIGLYTFKFYKTGQWRYVHIDDRIPCRPSGRVNFSRNFNPNESFVMLLEKAYAKLHGCYEAIACGMVEKVLQDLTPAAGIQCYRLERMKQRTICDNVWDILEQGMKSDSLIGCGRFVKDPYGENPSFRKGIMLDRMYQVMDMCATSAEPTAELDAITVGMICVKTLQRKPPRLSNRWCVDHPLWAQYPEIALDLRHRTRDIQFRRGLGPDPEQGEDQFLEALGAIPAPARFGEDGLMIDRPNLDEEPDEAAMFETQDKRQLGQMVQPFADDLHWIQIEDFVDMFNRLFLLTDVSFEKTGAQRRYVSRWVPGDYVAGSGGPPIIVTKHAVSVEEENTAPGTVSSRKASSVPTGTLQESSFAGSMESKSANETATAQSSIAKSAPATGSLQSQEPELEIQRMASINEYFTDNPMYPFTMSEPGSIAITLYQQDRRWSIGRLGDDPREVDTHTFASRAQRLQACMEYPVGIAFLVLKLTGLKMRVTDFRLKKIVSGSDALVFSGTTSAVLHLRPGRYAVVPYTHTTLSRSMDYVLHFHHLSQQVEFEIEDVIQQRLLDEAASDDEEDEDEPDDNDLLQLHPDSDDVSILSYEKMALEEDDDFDDDDLAQGSSTVLSVLGGVIDGGEAVEESSQEERSAAPRDETGTAVSKMVPPPRLLRYQEWEYVENTEELGVQQMYAEVGNVMQYLKSLRGEVRKLHGTLRALAAREPQAGEKEKGKLGLGDVVEQVMELEQESDVMSPAGSPR